MDGFLDSGMSAGEFLGALALVVLGIFAVRFKFDVNRFMEMRTERKRRRLMTICPHVVEVSENSQKALQSTFHSPPMTLAYVCRMCGMTTYLQMAEIDAHVRYYLAHLDEFERNTKRFNRLSRKL
jgi:transcription elongation factor Elf1